MSDIKILNVTLRNFLSYGNNTTVINLDKGTSTTLIKGEVVDEGAINGGSNGSGKTAILNALTYVFYDATISDISKDDMVNDVNNKNMEVTSTFDVGDGFTYRVERRRKMKAGATGNTACLYQIDSDKNETDITPHSIQLLNQKIEQLLGITYELFVRIIVFSATNVPFLQLSSTIQKNFLEELFQQTILTKKADLLKARIKDSENNIKTLQIKIDHVIAEQQRHQQLITQTNNRISQWDEANSSHMLEITKKLKQLNLIDIDQQQLFHQQSKQLLLEIKDNKALLDVEFNNMLKMNKSCESNKKQIEHLEQDMCPYCNQEYKTGQDKIQQLQQEVAQFTEQLPEIQHNIKQFQSIDNDLKSRYNTIIDLITTDNIDELVKNKSETEQLQNKLLDLSEAVNPHLETLDDLNNLDSPTVDYTAINKASKILEHQKFLLKLLTKKDSFVRKAILNKHLPMLNKRLQHYIKNLGLPFVVEFTHEMTATISKFGKKRSFGNLSNGQRARVNIALSFAFRDVLQAIHKKINMCILDEVLDVGLCPIGITAAAKLLKQVAKDDDVSLYIISHRDELQDMFDHIMKVQFKEGFSNIVQH